MPKAPPEAGVRFMQLRPSPEQLEAYREAAEADDRSLNVWALRALDKAVAESKKEKKGR
jgi:predicted HicB family RNase H-like nuclease